LKMQAWGATLKSLRLEHARTLHSAAMLPAYVI
jgi:hypothetical protein